MKPIVAILGLIIAAAAGAVGGIVASTTCAPPAAESTALAAQPMHATSSVGQSAPSAHLDQSDVQQHISDLSNEVARLRAELSAMREGRVRESLVPEGAPKEEIADDAFAVMHRNAILRVIADERADLARKEEEARKQAQLEASQQKAERTAKELGLNTTETRKLAEIYGQERDKRDEFMKAMRSGDVPDRDQMRQSFQEYRDWRTTALTTALGADMAQKVNDYDGERGGFGGRGFGPDGGGGGRGTNAAGGNNAGRNGGGGNARRSSTDTNPPGTGGGQGGG